MHSGDALGIRRLGLFRDRCPPCDRSDRQSRRPLFPDRISHVSETKRGCPMQPLTLTEMATADPNSPRRRRILFVAEAVALAHVARAFALAQTLDPDRYEVHLACDPRYLSLFDKISFPVHSIRTISGEKFRHRLFNGDPLYTVSDLREYTSQDLTLLAALSPDVVVGDFRLSLSVSARVACIPYLTVTNAHWSPYARSRFVVPDIDIIDRFGPRLGQILFSLMRPVIFAHHAYALNKVRHDYGLPSVGYNLLHVLTDADEVLYADLAELVPTL